ncbi:MAG: dihydrolipoamide acetyltransferase family protein [Candidatus Krumholzibacteriia bacterium]
MFEFKLPDLGEGIHEGEILKWHVREGDTVVEDAPLVDVETDKAAVTIPSPRGGKVMAVNGQVGDIVNVGDVVTVIDDGRDADAPAPAAQPAEPGPVPPMAGPDDRRVAEEAPPLPEDETEPEQRAAVAARRETGETRAAGEPGETKVAAPAGPAPATAVGTGPAPAPPPAARRRPVPATPATRRLARELGVDVNQVPPTGPGGRVIPDDVHRFVAGSPAPAAAAEQAAADPAATPHVVARQVRDDTAFAEFAAHAAATIPFLELEPLPDFGKEGPVEIEPLRSIRRKVARKMVTSMTLIPHVAHMDDADVTALDDFRRREKDRRHGQAGGHLTLLAFVMKAVTAGLKATPSFNASLDPFREEIVYKRYYNIGFAADTGRGLVVPVVRDTDRKSIVQISDDVAEKARLAREGTLPADQMRGGTFTITNVGPLGGTALLPTINYPEVAILGMGKVQDKPVVRDGEIVIRRILPLTLAFDHRIADGADAARFVAELVRQLSDPNLLLLET